MKIFKVLFKPFSLVIKIIKKIIPSKKFFSSKLAKRSLILLAVSGAIFGGYYYYKKKKELKERKAKEAAETAELLPMVKVFKIDRGDFNETLSLLGTVKGASEVQFKFEINGKIASFNFREGDEVAKDEVIASLNSDDVMTRLRHAKSKRIALTSKYQASREKLQVYKELYQMGAIIEATLKEMDLNVRSLKAEAETAKAEVELAQSQLEKTVISAPSDGVMGAIYVEVEDFVTPNDVVANFLEVKSVFVEVGVIEREIEEISVRQKVKIKFDAYPEEVFWGEVDNVSKMVRGQTRTLPAKIKLDNPGLKLLSGMLAECEIYLKEFKDTIIVPASSVINLGETVVVPLVKPSREQDEGIIELRNVVTGYSTENYTQILEGLKENDVIVQETQQPLNEGMKVKIIEVIKGSWN